MNQLRFEGGLFSRRVVDKCFKTGVPALRRGMKDARKIIKDPNWKPMPPMKDAK